MTSSESWRSQAACRRVPFEQMFPHEQNKQAIADIKEMCNSWCPVREECLDYADRFENTYRGTFGIWGGLTPRERIERRNADKERQEACGKPARKVGVEKHRERGENLCEACEAWQARREADAKRWEHAKDLIRAGYNRHEVVRLAGVHRDTVDCLRRELAEC